MKKKYWYIIGGYAAGALTGAWFVRSFGRLFGRAR